MMVVERSFAAGIMREPNLFHHSNHFQNSQNCSSIPISSEDGLINIPLDPVNPKSPLKQVQNLMRILFRIIRSSGSFGAKSNLGQIKDWKKIKNFDHFQIFDELFVGWLKEISFVEFGRGHGERMAFLINLYNILMVHNLIKKEGKRPTCPSTTLKYNIGGVWLSANQLFSAIRGLYTGTEVRSPIKELITKMKYGRDSFVQDHRIVFVITHMNEYSPPLEIFGVEDLNEKLENARCHYIDLIRMEEPKKRIRIPVALQEYYAQWRMRSGEDVDVRIMVTKDLRSRNHKMNTMITGDFKVQTLSASSSVSVFIEEEALESPPSEPSSC